MRNNRISKAFSIWGQFNDSDMNFFSNIKDIVNSNLKGPNFEIHITLTGPILEYTNKTIPILKKISLETKSFRLNVQNYNLNNEKYTALYVKIKKSNELINLRKNLENKLKIRFSDYNPHISLYYGTEKKQKKIKVVKHLPKLPKKTILKKICLVDYDETIDKWKILKRFTLV